MEKTAHAVSVIWHLNGDSDRDDLHQCFSADDCSDGEKIWVMEFHRLPDFDPEFDHDPDPGPNADHFVLHLSYLSERDIKIEKFAVALDNSAPKELRRFGSELLQYRISNLILPHELGSESEQANE